MIKLNPALKGKYESTGKVISNRFEHRYLGKIDLEKIGEPMAEKLVKTGHLKAVKPAKKEPAEKKEVN